MGEKKKKGKGVKMKRCYIKAKQFLEGRELLLASASRGRNSVLAVSRANQQRRSRLEKEGSLGVSRRWVQSGIHTDLSGSGLRRQSCMSDGPSIV